MKGSDEKVSIMSVPSVCSFVWDITSANYFLFSTEKAKQITGLLLRILNRKFGGSWDAFERAILDQFDFTQLEDFGQVMNDNIYCWYSDEEEAKLWRPALNHITFLKEETTMPEAQNNPFAGKTVVATGKLENYTRDGIQMKLLSLGARPASSVSKKTDYLIVGENAGSKLTKAQTLGVTTLTEQQFLQMLADAGIEA